MTWQMAWPSCIRSAVRLAATLALIVASSTAHEAESVAEFSTSSMEVWMSVKDLNVYTSWWTAPSKGTMVASKLMLLDALMMGLAKAAESFEARKLRAPDMMRIVVRISKLVTGVLTWLTRLDGSGDMFVNPTECYFDYATSMELC